MKIKIGSWLRLRTLVSVAALSLAAIAFAQGSDWKPYSYPADGFLASFPNSPEVTRKDIPTEAGSFQLHSYVAEVNSVALTVNVCDYGSKATGKDPEVMLQGLKNAALQNSSSHLIREKKIALGAYPGLEFQIASDSVQINARIYMVGSILYQTLVVAPLDKPLPDASRFLDSFQLVPKSTN